MKTYFVSFQPEGQQVIKEVTKAQDSNQKRQLKFFSNEMWKKLSQCVKNAENTE